MKLLSFDKEDWFVLFALCLVFLYSVLTGRLSADSINYLIMATPSDKDQLCIKNGEFYGVYACGYPLLIALMSKLSSLDSFTVSKLLNTLILLIHYVIWSYIFNSKRLALILTLLPFNVYISTFTWSENATLLAFSLYCLALLKIEKKQAVGVNDIAIAFVAILIGCVSRYAFAPFCLLLFLASFIVIKRKALLLLPGFIVNAIIFIIYKDIASVTDKERFQAPEQFSWLLLAFGYVVLLYLVKHIIACSPFLLYFKSHFSLKQLHKITESKWALFFISLGIGYLCLSFLLRVWVQFDMYDIRTVGFGVSLCISAIVIAYNQRIRKVNLSIIAFVLLGSQFISGSILINELQEIYNGNFFARNTVNDFVIAQQKARNNIVIPVINDWHEQVKGTSIKAENLKYPETFFWRVPGMPHYRQLDVTEFHAALKGARCQFIFSDNLTEEQLEKALSRTYRIGLFSEQKRYSAELKSFVMAKFRKRDTSCY